MSAENGHHGPQNAALEQGEKNAKLIVRSSYQVIDVFIFGLLYPFGIEMQMMPEGEAHVH